MIVKQSDVFRLIKKAYDEKWGYIYGTKGETWTAEKQAAATRSQTVKYGSKWIGRRVTDCSGLACYAFRSLGGQMFHGSNTIWNRYVSDHAELVGGKRADGKEIWIGDPVFKRKAKAGGGYDYHHIGYYVGNGYVIEAKGTVYGVVMSKAEEWDTTARWNDVENDFAQVASVPEQVQKPEKRKFVRVTANVNVRYGNGTEYAKAGTLLVGSEYNYIATAINGWHAIKFGTQVMWVSGSYTEVIEK